jgi:hypothetical protein
LYGFKFAKVKFEWLITPIRFRLKLFIIRYYKKWITIIDLWRIE